MLRNMAQDIDRAADTVRRMAALVEHALGECVRAILDRDKTAAESAIARGDEVDRLEIEVWAGCHKLLARYQPLARDLRRTVALMQVASDLERMGDLAESLAERALRLLDFPDGPVPDRIRDMADRVSRMVRQGCNAFFHEDTALARAVVVEDDAVDAEHAAIIDGLIARMRSHPTEVEPCLSVFSAVRRLERVADHATNIAENAIFLVEGEAVRHRSGRAPSVS